MKMFAAAVIVVGAVLAAPVAIGQSQGLLPGAALQAALAVMAAPVEPNSSSFKDSSLSPSGPDSAFSWVMALAFLGFVVLRRTRSGL